jgi:thioredoxin-like negative regulator of GroEL
MDTVTYPDARVKEELARWVVLKVDIAEHRQVAEWFEVAGIPVAVAVTGVGVELGRIEGFVAPAKFRARLERLHPRSEDTPGSKGGP